MIEQFGDTQSSTTQPSLSPAQIKLHLSKSFKILSKKSPTPIELQRCHSIISQMMKSELFFDTSIALILLFQTNHQYPNIPKLIITTLSTFLKHQQSASRLVKKIDRHTLNRKLIDTFLDITLQQDYRVLLIKSYTQYFHAPGMETIRKQTVELLCNTFGLISIHLKKELNTNHSITQQQTDTLMSYILIAKAITKGPIAHVELKSIVTTFLPAIQIMLIHFLAGFKSSIIQKDQANFKARSGICCKLLQFFKEIVIGTSKQYSYLVKQSVMMDQQIKNIIYSTLSLAILHEQSSSQLIQQLVIQSNGNKFIQRINEMKSYCVSIVNYFAKLCLQHKSNFKQLEKEQYKMPLEICRYFINNIPTIIIRQFEALNYPSRELPHPGLYKVILNALSNIVRINCFFKQSYQIRNRLFFNLCLPLLMRKQEKYANGQEFKGKRQDILNTHSLDIPENAACKLIESYIDRIDGSIVVFSSALINVIQFQLSANPNFFSKLPVQLTNSYFFKEVNYMLQIECCLSVFALFSYMTIGRQDLVNMLQNLLVSRKSFFFDKNSNGMFKASVLLTYSYYVDNFYGKLVAGKSSSQHFHIEVLQYCCSNIQLFTTSSAQPPTKEHLLQEIAALQSLDCISNCISQRLFLHALFQKEENVMLKGNEQYFYALFEFLIKQLHRKLNIDIIDKLIEFFVETIRSQCKYGHAIKRFHYEYKQVPIVIRMDICNMICEQIYNVYNKWDVIDNGELMKAKIMNLLQLILTCCQFPDQFLNHQFFALQIGIEDIRDISQPIDIFLRRMIVFAQEGQAVNRQILYNILGVSVKMLEASLLDNKMDNLFGILLNLIIVDNQIIDDLAIYLSTTLIKLLKTQDQSNNYDEDLESFIQKMAYLNLIAIYHRFNPQDVWCNLTESIQSFLQSRSTKGIIATNSIPYVGKLLSISLVCLYNMQKIQNIETQQSIHLWSNILRSADVYATISQRQIVSTLLINLLGSQTKIQQNNEQCKKCFNMVSHLLYKSYSKAIPQIKQNYDNNDQSSGCDNSEDEELDIQSTSLNYQQYKVASNQYTNQQGKEKYILLFKNLCHKLKHESPQFIFNVVEALPLPIKNFVKNQVFYYESTGSQPQSIRKVIKIKKVISK